MKRKKRTIKENKNSAGMLIFIELRGTHEWRSSWTIKDR
jgi:hypothetical protein